jgi:hypothetical protein
MHFGLERTESGYLLVSRSFRGAFLLVPPQLLLFDKLSVHQMGEGAVPAPIWGKNVQPIMDLTTHPVRQTDSFSTRPFRQGMVQNAAANHDHCARGVRKSCLDIIQVKVCLAVCATAKEQIAPWKCAPCVSVFWSDSVRDNGDTAEDRIPGMNVRVCLDVDVKSFWTFELGNCFVTGEIERTVCEGNDGVEQDGGLSHADQPLKG